MSNLYRVACALLVAVAIALGIFIVEALAPTNIQPRQPTVLVNPADGATSSITCDVDFVAGEGWYDVCTHDEGLVQRDLFEPAIQWVETYGCVLLHEDHSIAEVLPVDSCWATTPEAVN